MAAQQGGEVSWEAAGEGRSAERLSHLEGLLERGLSDEATLLI